MEVVERIENLPDLNRQTIHVWGIHLPGFADGIQRLAKLLSPDELEKADRFHRRCDRDASISGRGALRVLLSGYANMKADMLRFAYLETGKPYLPGSSIAFNVSHSGEWVVLAFGLERRIGVDLEMIRDDVDVQAIASRYFTDEESVLMEQSGDHQATFFQFWARKEAYVKASGSALFRELSSFAVPLEDGEKDGWHFHRLEAGSNYAAAVVTDKPVEQMPCYDFGGLQWEN